MLYFLPGNKTPDLELIDQFGLRYAFDEMQYQCGQVRPSQGPESQSGFVLSCAGLTPDYSPANQIWFKHPLGAHFGWPTDQRPTPDKLERRTIMQGKPVRLVDGNDWIIPIARSWVIEDQSIRYTEEFARTLDFKNGKWEPGNVIPSHELFAGIGITVFDAWRSSEDGKFQIPDATNLCCQTICLNYRLSAVEVGALGLLTNDPSYVWGILRTVIDMDGYLELQKKILEDRSTSYG